MELIKKIIIKDPPTKYIKRVQRRKKGSKKKSLEDVYYLTANLFYSGDTHFSVRSEIINAMKNYLHEYLDNIPKCEKMRLKLTYYRMSDDWDLDNKGYFWQKILLDLFKTPTSREIKRAEKYKKQIKTLEVIKDDSVRYVDELTLKYEKGEHAIVIEIYGRLANVQQKLL